MDIKEKLYSKSSSLHGDKKAEYEAALDGYFRMKEDLALMRTPITLKSISLDLYNAHRTVESNVTVEEKKIGFIEAIRLYISFVSSGLVDAEKEKIKKVLETKCLGTLYSKAMNVCVGANGDSNLVVGLIRSYYDTTLMLLDNNFTSSIIERDDFWAFESLEADFFEGKIDNMEPKEIIKVLNHSKSAMLSYVVSLYNASKVTSEIMFVDKNIDEFISILDGYETSSTRLSNFIREIKKGNHTIAYDNHRKSRLLTMKNELKNFNSLLLNFNR